jgi:mitogen-activated protein kinase 15
MSEEIEPHIYRKFEIQQKLGKGAYGVVWKAIEKKTGQVVALKKVFEAFQNSTDAQRTFREVMILQEINGHENIVKLLNVIKAENKKDLYLVFEFMETDLHAVIKAGILTPIHKQYIIFQILKGLKYIHSGEIVHRDLKPSNVLINTECLIKIADFGLARSVAVKGDDGDPIMTEYVATRWYRAPEIVLGSNKYSKAVDVWSVGCILAELINGKALFPGKSTLNQVELILEVLGKPSESDLQGLNLESTMNIIKNIKLRNNKSFENYFKTDDKLALDFLKKSLTFNHKNRLTIEEALEHPFLENFRESEEYQVLNKIVEIPIDENTRFSTSVYQEALYNEIIRKKKEQRRKWKEEYLKSLRLETKDKNDTQNQITKKESKQVSKKETKPTKMTDEAQETEKKLTGGTLTDIKDNSKQDSILISKEETSNKKVEKKVKENKEKKSRSNLNNGSTHKRPKKGFFPRNKDKKKPTQEKQKSPYSKKENEVIKKDKRSETPTVFMRKKSPTKEFGYKGEKRKTKDQRDAFKRRRSAYDKGKHLFKEKKNRLEETKMEQYTRAKKGKKKEKLLKKVSRPKNSNSSGKSLAAFTSKRNHLKYSRGLLTHNFKKNNGQNNFQALFVSKSKQRDGSMGVSNYLSNSRKNALSKNKNYKDPRKISSQLKSSPKGSNPYIKGSGSRHSEMLFNQNAMTRFHPPNYGVYANERQRFLSKFDGVFKSNQNGKEIYKKSSHDKGKLAKHYSSLNAYEKNFYRGSLQGKEGKSGTLYNGHLKPKRSLKMGSNHKEKHGNVKLTKFRSRDKVSGVGFSYRNVPQSHSQYDNNISKSIYEDNLYSGISANKQSRGKYLNESNNKRHMGSLLGGHLFMKSKAKSKKNMKRSPVRINSKINNRGDFKRSEDLWVMKGNTKEGKERKDYEWKSKKRMNREGLQERDRNRRKQTRGELENKVTLLYRNLIKQEKQ